MSSDRVDYVGGIPVPRWIERVAQLIAFSLVPLVGVLLFGWDWRGVLVLYWLENLTVGAATVVKIVRARPSAGGGTVTFNGRVLDPHTLSTSAGLRWGLAGFFCLHYGLFTLVHGIFVFAIVGGAFDGIGGGDAAPPTMRAGDWVAAVLVWAVGSAVAVGTGLRGPRSTDTIGRLFGAPYTRIVALHLTIIGGALLISALGWPPIAAVLLIVLHAGIDVGTWVVSRRRAAAVAPASS